MPPSISSFWGISSFWLERYVRIVEVAGSTPACSTSFLCVVEDVDTHDCGSWRQVCHSLNSLSQVNEGNRHAPWGNVPVKEIHFPLRRGKEVVCLA